MPQLEFQKALINNIMTTLYLIMILDEYSKLVPESEVETISGQVKELEAPLHSMASSTTRKTTKKSI